MGFSINLLNTYLEELNKNFRVGVRVTVRVWVRVSPSAADR